MNKQEYEKQLKKLKYENDILKKQLNELKNVKNDDEYPQVGDIYWFINTGGDIVYNRWENDEVDNYPEEKAIKVLDMIQKHIETHGNNVFQMPRDIIIIDDDEVEV